MIKSTLDDLAFLDSWANIHFMFLREMFTEHPHKMNKQFEDDLVKYIRKEIEEDIYERLWIHDILKYNSLAPDFQKYKRLLFVCMKKKDVIKNEINLYIGFKYFAFQLPLDSLQHYINVSDFMFCLYLIYVLKISTVKFFDAFIQRFPSRSLLRKHRDILCHKYKYLVSGRKYRTFRDSLNKLFPKNPLELPTIGLPDGNEKKIKSFKFASKEDLFFYKYFYGSKIDFNYLDEAFSRIFQN
jgi:hypothetical protein